MWGSVLISSILGTEFPGPGTVYVGQTLKFWRPITIGDTLTVTITCSPALRAQPPSAARMPGVNQDGLKVIDGTAEVMARPRRSRARAWPAGGHHLRPPAALPARAVG